MSAKSTAKRVLLQGGGWILVIVGLAAMVLPGPGLLALFAGMAMLATQYEWADRRLAPVRKAAMRGAADSVKNWPRILLSVVSVCLLIGLGVYWGLRPAAPSWWPVGDQWWLVGGWGTGATLIGSGVIALAMLVYSYLNFRGGDDDEDPTGPAVTEIGEHGRSPDPQVRPGERHAPDTAHRSITFPLSSPQADLRPYPGREMTGEGGPAVAVDNAARTQGWWR